MDAVIIMVLAFIGYILAYKLYGKFIGQKIFNLRNDVQTPAVELEDGHDFVPTKKGIVFGHHFTSIAGTGPIVGPAVGVIWGWAPALLWVFLGTIVMGAVHDFGALIISMRNQGKSISEVTAKYINPRTRTMFFIVVLLELWIVIAIFGLVIAVIFKMYPQSVLPVWLQIPIAMTLGWAIYKKGAAVNKSAMFAVIAMYATIVLGSFMPMNMPSVAGIPATGVWTILLLIYAFIASTLPVTTLLQPRDYINAWQLVIAMALLVLGAFAASLFGGMTVVAPAVQATPAGAPSMWPFLFITIACGAISGFHSLVASGTSSKQLASEGDATMVGFGAMLLEGMLATLVIIAVAAGIGMGYEKEGATLVGSAAWTTHYASWSSAAGLGSKVSAFVDGAANMIAVIGVPRQIAVVIMGVFVASFAGTTLDTATRLQRYVIQELGSDIKVGALSNKWVATSFAVLSALILAFATGPDGKGALKLWPLFGAVNQTLAALALITVSVYLKEKGGIKWLVAGLPAMFMAAMTIWALVINEKNFIASGNALLYIVNGLIILLAAWVLVEGFSTILKTKEEGETSTV